MLNIKCEKKKNIVKIDDSVKITNKSADGGIL